MGTRRMDGNDDDDDDDGDGDGDGDHHHHRDDNNGIMTMGTQCDNRLMGM